MKKNKTAILVVIVTILVNLVIFLTSYWTDHPRERERHLFGASYMTRGNPFFNILNEAINEAVEENGDILIVRDPSQNQQRQNEQILEMIDEGIEVLFLCPVHKEEVRPALEACENAGVIVINVDTAVEDHDKVQAIIETDNYKAGVLCAQDMMKRCENARIVIFGNDMQQSTIDREKGFKDTIEKNPDYKIICVTDDSQEYEVAATRMENILNVGTDFNVVFAVNDPSALGAYATLEKYSRTKDVLIYGVDGSPDFKKMLQHGNVTGTSTQSPKTMGKYATETAYDLLNGEEVNCYLQIDPTFINQENLANYELDDWQ